MRFIAKPCLSLLSVVIMITPLAAVAQGNSARVEVIRELKHDTSIPLRDMRPMPIEPEKKEGRKPRPIPVPPQSGKPDPVVQIAPGASVASVGGFAGIGIQNYNVNSAPPDTNGAAGTTQYVQVVNTVMAVFTKDGTRLSPNLAINTLWSGFGGRCQSDNDGDPIVLFDHLANRWIISQFAVSSTPYTQCIAVSTTDDATGSYNRYAYTFNQFNDYPKFGVWPDAYYATYNMFTSSFQGARICAYDRARMLAGQSATQICTQLSTSYGGLLPADLDGNNLPPAGAPNYLLNFGSNSLRLWTYKPDFTAGTAAITGPVSIGVASFTPMCNGGTCVPQPGTPQKLDSLADRLMYRLAYRNDGAFEHLVVNHSVALGGSGKNASGGVRWYELRKPTGSGSFGVYQQGTFAPDGNYRWMGSIAQDKVGNTILGYSVSGSVKPSIRFTSRDAADPLGTMGQEQSALEGTGVQIKDFYNLTRWGDYSSMSVDPVDGCTMYYTTEYIPANGTFNWQTYVAKIKLPSCN
jgi:hypothetical protein